MLIAAIFGSQRGHHYMYLDPEKTVINHIKLCVFYQIDPDQSQARLKLTCIKTLSKEAQKTTHQEAGLDSTTTLLDLPHKQHIQMVVSTSTKA